jgi:hypothetical protein
MTPLRSQPNLASRSGRGARNGREGFNQHPFQNEVLGSFEV